jgi:Class III cytochrome C family
LITSLGIVMSWVVGGVALSAQSAAPTNDDCQACHAEPSLTRADGRPVVVEPKAFAVSAHASFSCVDCHSDLATVTEFPHPERLAAVTCATCHDDPAAGLARSVHAAIPAAAGGPASCVTCHGPAHQIKPAADPESPTNKLRVALTCAQCHGDTVARGRPRGPAVAGQFADSIHGVALTRTTVAPTCSDCHSSHDIRRVADPESRVHALKVPGTCGTCHANQQRLYGASVHADLLWSGASGAPHCASCHTAHSIGATATDQWQLSAVEECGTCHREALATYRDSFHGQVTALGFTPVAKCADCHQAHQVFRTSDARSSVSAANRVATCQACHPSANLNFVRYQPHANKDDRDRLPALYYAARFMDALIVGVFGFFGVHTVMWFVRERLGPADETEVPHE